MHFRVDVFETEFFIKRIKHIITFSYKKCLKIVLKTALSVKVCCVERESAEKVRRCANYIGSMEALVEKLLAVKRDMLNFLILIFPVAATYFGILVLCVSSFGLCFHLL